LHKFNLFGVLGYAPDMSMPVENGWIGLKSAVISVSAAQEIWA
jgi:hypothetical protein